MHRFLFIFLCLIGVKCTAQNAPPLLRGVSITTSNDITLQWDQPNSTTNFFSYDIYSATSFSGTYTLVTSITNVSQTSYTDGIGNANIQPKFYYLIATYNGGVQQSPHTDTLQSIRLFLTPSGSDMASVKLDWSAMHQPTLAQHSNGKYHIYKKINSVNYFVDSTLNTTYNDTNNAVCDTSQVAYTVFFKFIAASNNYSCSSSTDSVLRRDNMPPKTPDVIRVSVDTLTGKTFICWKTLNDKDVKGFTGIIDPSGSQSPTLDTAFVPNTCLLLANSQPTVGAETYSIFAFDSCGNNGTYNSGGHTTAYLNAQIDYCQGKITLQWTPYKGWTNGVVSYNIYVSINDSYFALLATVSPSTLNYTHTGLTPFSSFKYFIKALKLGEDSVISISNVSNKLDYKSPNAPQYMDISSIDASSSSGATVIRLSTDPQGAPKTYRLLRGIDSTKLSVISTFNTVPGQGTYTFTDNSASKSSQSYYYRVIAVDSCNQPIQQTILARSMLLQIAHNDNLQEILSWNAYRGWNDSNVTYNVYENVDGVFNANAVNSFSTAQSNFNRDISMHVGSSGQFCYYIEVVEANGLNKSYSNKVCDMQPPLLFVPNALSPASEIFENRTFKPVSVFVNPAKYLFRIYNRWSKIVFQTLNPNEAWDGTEDGTPLSMGAYVYYIQFTATDGLEFTKIGTVYLIK